MNPETPSRRPAMRLAALAFALVAGLLAAPAPAQQDFSKV